MSELPEIFTQYYNTPVLQFLAEKADQCKVNYSLQRSSKNKLGSFSSKSLWKRNEIFVARNLEPDIMLIVLCHELAHAEHFLKAKRRDKPHGLAWKMIYVRNLEEIKTLHEFSEESGRTLQGLIEKPRASIDPRVREILEDEVLLSALPMGAQFQFGRALYEKKELRRTRFLCIRQRDGRAFAFRKDAVVKRI